MNIKHSEKGLDKLLEKIKKNYLEGRNYFHGFNDSDTISISFLVLSLGLIFYIFISNFSTLSNFIIIIGGIILSFLIIFISYKVHYKNIYKNKIKKIGKKLEKMNIEEFEIFESQYGNIVFKNYNKNIKIALRLNNEIDNNEYTLQEKIEYLNDLNDKNFEKILYDEIFSEKVTEISGFVGAFQVIGLPLIVLFLLPLFSPIENFLKYRECGMNIFQSISMSFQSKNSKEIVKEYCSKKIAEETLKYNENKIQTLLNSKFKTCSYSQYTSEQIKEVFKETDSTKIIEKLNKDCSIEILKNGLNELNLKPNIDFENLDNLKDIENAIKTVNSLKKFK